MDFSNDIRKIANITAVFFISFCAPSFAEYDRTWVQVGSGYGAFNLQLKMVDGNTGWALEAGAYYPPAMFEVTIINGETNKEVDPMLKVFAVSRLWSSAYSWGYTDVGLGLGIGSGSWTKNCKEIEPSFLGSTYECDFHEGTRLGIPLQASAAFGKYVGLGVSLNAFIHADDAQVRFLFTLPLGNFTR
ncbi:MAG: hypothetical protein JKY50_01545 [Oleispira sp.]|nr:hypothetical protein [Oleispira sp.]MBL4879946.1 hypothetical protein [Oleispira sp.]